MNKNKTQSSIVSLLKAVSYFSNLDDEALMLIARSAIHRDYEAGQVILLEGEPCPGLYIIESGWLKAIKIGMDGREQVLQTFAAGEVFNAISVFTDAPNQATVTSLETSKVWMVRRDILLKMLEENPSLGRLVVKDLAARVMQLIRMVEDLSTRSVEARLARLLLDQAEGEVVLRQRWATQTEMAARIGTVPDMVNRGLRKLAAAGMIQVERHQIRILDKQGLKVFAQLID